MNTNNTNTIEFYQYNDYASSFIGDTEDYLIFLTKSLLDGYTVTINNKKTKEVVTQTLYVTDAFIAQQLVIVGMRNIISKKEPLSSFKGNKIPRTTQFIQQLKQLLEHYKDLNITFNQTNSIVGFICEEDSNISIFKTNDVGKFNIEEAQLFQ